MPLNSEQGDCLLDLFEQTAVIAHTHEQLTAARLERETTQKAAAKQAATASAKQAVKEAKSRAESVKAAYEQSMETLTEMIARAETIGVDRGQVLYLLIRSLPRAVSDMICHDPDTKKEGVEQIEGD